MSLRSKLIVSFLAAASLAACQDVSDPAPDTTVSTPTEEVVTSETPTTYETVVETLRPLRDGEKMARCVIGPDRYVGDCVFFAESNGSFAISRRDESQFYPDVTMVTVSITAVGEAEVRGLTTSGRNSRWGPAKRSSDDKACWVGSDFSVCAY